MTKEELYTEIRESHPDWSEEQVWTQVSVRLSGEKTISELPKDTSINNSEIKNEIIRTIFERAGYWLEQYLPIIWEKVKGWFSGVLTNIIDWFRGRDWSFITNIFTD